MEPEYLYEHQIPTIICNVSVNPENSSGRFLWQINGFSLMQGLMVGTCKYESCVSEGCDCVFFRSLSWELSGK